MSEPDFDINKINRRLLNTIKEILIIPEKIDDFVKNMNQKTIDDLAEQINKVDECFMKAKRSIAFLISTVSDTGEEESIENMDIEQTENGVKF